MRDTFNFFTPLWPARVSWVRTQSECDLFCWKDIVLHYTSTRNDGVVRGCEPDWTAVYEHMFGQWMLSLEYPDRAFGGWMFVLLWRVSSTDISHVEVMASAYEGSWSGTSAGANTSGCSVIINLTNDVFPQIVLVKFHKKQCGRDWSPNYIQNVFLNRCQWMFLPYQWPTITYSGISYREDQYRRFGVIRQILRAGTPYTHHRVDIESHRDLLVTAALTTIYSDVVAITRPHPTYYQIMRLCSISFSF